MTGEMVHYGLLAGLAIALLYAAFSDLRERRIANWLTAGIALAAPLFWWVSGLTLWPGVALQLAIALLTFAILAVVFALRAIGGGDVKLLAALALWIAPAHFLQLVIAMALLGGLLTVIFAGWHLARRRKDRLTIPYGIAISAASLWILSVHYLPAGGTGTVG